MIEKQEVDVKMVEEEEIKAEKKVESEEKKKKKMMIIEKKRKRRYGLLLACKDSEYVKKVHGGYYNVFVKAFGEEGEEWDLFRIVDGEFPQIEDINNFDGFVVSGSPYDAYANDPWILTLCFFIQTLYTMNKTLLGVCFGHQVHSFFLSLFIYLFFSFICLFFSFFL